MSKRRQRESKEYSKLRKEFLAQRPICEAHMFVFPADGHYTTDFEHMIYTESSTDVHHTAGRHKGNYLNRDTWLAVCRDCHDWIHKNPKQAEEMGLLSKDR